MQVCKNQEFYQLSADQLATLLKSDDLNVPTEQDVFHALISWVKYDLDAREKYIPELLGLIRLPLLPPAVSLKYSNSITCRCNQNPFYFFSSLLITLNHYALPANVNSCVWKHSNGIWCPKDELKFLRIEPDHENQQSDDCLRLVE